MPLVCLFNGVWCLPMFLLNVFFLFVSLLTTLCLLGGKYVVYFC